jgi:site-specific DNA recombinase
MNDHPSRARFKPTPSPTVVRAAIYSRVSTGRQAEHDLSIPDQQNQAEVSCAARAWIVVDTYAERGASATDDRRSQFQAMIERACDGTKPYDVIVVHSLSRYFRNAFQAELYIRKLKKQGVRLVSLTQELGDDPAQEMMRQVIALFDEYQSKENAKHVTRAMKANASAGFWNGATPPLGYRLREAERRGSKIKRVLVVDPVEANWFDLFFGSIWRAMARRALSASRMLRSTSMPRGIGPGRGPHLASARFIIF